MAESAFVITGNAQNFAAQVLKNSENVPVLVDFWAAWCQPCQMLMPVLVKLAEEYQGKFLLVKVNSDEEQGLAMQYGVRSLPTVKLFRYGKMQTEFMGVQPESVIRQLLEPFISRPSDALREQAQALLAEGQKVRGQALLERAFNEDPKNLRVIIALAGFYLAEKQTEAAKQCLKEVPANQQDQADYLRLQAWLQLLQLQEQPDTLPSIQNALNLLFNKQEEQALNALLTTMQSERGAKNQAKDALVAAFAYLNDEERVQPYRRKMFQALH
jgi:putative thioredoxin